MDPVNRWLTTIILFMVAFLILIGWKAGSGRYELAVEKSTLFANHSVVYVVDTKDGDVYAKLMDENDLHYNNNVKSRAQKVFGVPSAYSVRKGY